MMAGYLFIQVSYIKMKYIYINIEEFIIKIKK